MLQRKRNFLIAFLAFIGFLVVYSFFMSFCVLRKSEVLNSNHMVTKIHEYSEDVGIKSDDIDLFIKDINDGRKSIDYKLMIVFISSVSVLLAIVTIFVTIYTNFVFAPTKISPKNKNTKDLLTGIYNREYAERNLKTELRLFKIKRQSPLVFMIDIDNFKKINDSYGRDVGDLVICSVTNAIKRTMRTNDSLFRWGGEEFLLFYNDINISDSYMYGYKLNREISEAIVHLNQDGEKIELSVTASIGVSWFTLKDENEFSVIKRSDIALFEAKRSGKNCTRTYLA